MLFSEFYQKGNIGIPNHRLLSKYVVPTFPIKNLVRNKDVLIESYKQGDYTAPVSIEGWVDVSGNEIILRTVPYGSDFGTVTSAIRTTMKDRKHWLWNYVISASQYSSSEAEFSLEVKRGQNPFEVLDKLRPLLRFNHRWHPLYNYMKDGRAINLNPATLTFLWYQERMISIAGGLKYRQSDLIYRKMTLEALLQICEHTDEVITIIRNSEDEEDSIKALHSRFEQLTWKQAKIIVQQKFSTLAKANRKQIELDIEQTDADLQIVVDNFSRVHETIYTDAQFLKKKYKSTRQSKIVNDFIGYVQFGSMGIIHFFNEEEMYEILNSKGWSANINKTIHLYDPKYPNRFLVKNGKLVPMTEPSKEMTCEGVVCYPADRTDFTLAIGADQSTCVLERSVTGIYGNFTICPITKTFYAIHRNGKVTQEIVYTFSIRKTISKGAKTDLIFGLPEKTKDVVVIHMNTTDINSLRIDRILLPHDMGNLKTVPIGDMFILGIYPIDTAEIYVNIPESCTKNIVMNHLVVKNIAAMFKDGKNHQWISLSKSASNPFNRRFRRNSAVRTLFVLDLSEE